MTTFFTLLGVVVFSVGLMKIIDRLDTPRKRRTA